MTEESIRAVPPGRPLGLLRRALPEALRAAEQTSAALADLPGRPLVVGGDRSIPLEIFAALRTAVGPAGLWFVDGHPDYMDGRISDTGETADMDLALLTGVGAEPLVTLAGHGGLCPRCHASRSWQGLILI